MGDEDAHQQLVEHMGQGQGEMCVWGRPKRLLVGHGSGGGPGGVPGGVSLTGDGPQHVGDEDLHQQLVERVVAVAGPAQGGLELGQDDEAALGETLLRFVMAGGGGGGK